MLRKVSDDLQGSSADFSMTRAGCPTAVWLAAQCGSLWTLSAPPGEREFFSANAQAGQRLDYHANTRRCAAKVHFRSHRRTERVDR